MFPSSHLVRLVVALGLSGSDAGSSATTTTPKNDQATLLRILRATDAVARSVVQGDTFDKEKVRRLVVALAQHAAFKGVSWRQRIASIERTALLRNCDILDLDLLSLVSTDFVALHDNQDDKENANHTTHSLLNDPLLETDFDAIQSLMNSRIDLLDQSNASMSRIHLAPTQRVNSSAPLSQIQPPLPSFEISHISPIKKQKYIIPPVILMDNDSPAFVPSVVLDRTSNSLAAHQATSRNEDSVSLDEASRDSENDEKAVRKAFTAWFLCVSISSV
ncbi:hypothetical protein HDU98_011468 [Podochytrium sp. JEL0797]|nr:hypothetical protein HDU98_011468 [Podochytrium sp. JEL0797]